MGYVLNVCLDDICFTMLPVISPHCSGTKGSSVPWAWNTGMSLFALRPFKEKLTPILSQPTQNTCLTISNSTSVVSQTSFTGTTVQSLDYCKELLETNRQCSGRSKQQKLDIWWNSLDLEITLWLQPIFHLKPNLKWENFWEPRRSFSTHPVTQSHIR